MIGDSSVPGDSTVFGDNAATYVILSVVVLALIALVTLPVLRRMPSRPIVLTALVLIALTAVFDNVIVGLGIVAYDDALISGVRLWHAPIEDFAYALGAVMLMPALWTWLGRLGQGTGTGPGSSASNNPGINAGTEEAHGETVTKKTVPNKTVPTKTAREAT